MRRFRVPVARLRGAHPGAGARTTSSPKAREKPEPPVRVVIHNDDYTPMEFVTAVLHDVFKLPWHRAAWVMLKAHTTGAAVVGVLPRKLGEARTRDAVARARDHGWPLRITIEADE